jgi:uncharacterized protein YaeQ
MALKSTIFRAELQISDMDRSYYQNHVVTVARHPSETNERMMMRILAFILNASEHLTFASGLTSNDEPDLWEKDLTGSITLWIMVGLPDEKMIKRACGRAKNVIIYSYGGTAAEIWWSSLSKSLKASNISVINITHAESTALADLAERTMKIQATVQDGIIWLSSAGITLEIYPLFWLRVL